MKSHSGPSTQSLKDPAAFSSERSNPSKYDTALASILQEMRLDELCSSATNADEIPRTPSPRSKTTYKTRTNASASTERKTRSSLLAAPSTTALGKDSRRSPLGSKANATYQALPTTPVSIKHVRWRTQSRLRGDRLASETPKTTERSCSSTKRQARSHVQHYDPFCPPPCPPPPVEAFPPTPASIADLLRQSAADEDGTDGVVTSSTYSAQRVTINNNCRYPRPPESLLPVTEWLAPEKQQPQEQGQPKPVGPRKRLLSLFKGSGCDTGDAGKPKWAEQPTLLPPANLFASESFTAAGYSSSAAAEHCTNTGPRNAGSITFPSMPTTERPPRLPTLIFTTSADQDEEELALRFGDSSAEYLRRPHPHFVSGRMQTSPSPRPSKKRSSLSPLSSSPSRKGSPLQDLERRRRKKERRRALAALEGLRLEN